MVMSDNKKKEEEDKEKEEGTPRKEEEVTRETRLVRVEAQFSCFRENRLPLPDAT